MQENLNLEIIVKSIELTEYIQRQIDKHFVQGIEKLIKDFDSDMKNSVMKIEALTKPGKKGFKINFKMWLPGNKQIYAEKENDELKFTLTDLREAVIKQIKRYKADLKDS